MATDYVVPTSMELQLVAQDLLPRLILQRPIFTIFPIVEVDQSILAWEQLDNFTGLQQVRGLNGVPPRVKRTGGKRYLTEPGVYGEFTIIDELEITRRRAFGSLDQLIDITDLVAVEQQRLLQRRLDRVELILWTLLTTGTFSVSTITGGVAHTDSYTTQTFTATTGWGTLGTSTPLADFRSVKLLGRGHSVNFGAEARAYANSGTLNNFYNNANANDLFGRRTGGFGTFNTPGEVNSLLAGDNLPQLVEYDAGYIDDTGTFHTHIPNNKVVVVGQRPDGAPVGDYAMTRNANNPGQAPGAYMKVVDNGEDNVPRSIEVHDGHNGAPRLYWPSAVVIMSV